MPTPRRSAALLAIALAAVGVTACSDTNSEPTEVDEQRLDALVAAAPFDAAAWGDEWFADPARGAFRSLNMLAHRGTIRMDAALPEAQPADAALGSGWDRTWPAATAVMAELVANGWQPSGVECIAPDGYGEPGVVRIIATGALDDGSIAAASISVGQQEDALTAAAYAPYHAEADDPWLLDALDEPTCLDAEVPPSVDVAAGDFEGDGYGVGSGVPMP